ncbi:MAG: ABC transporter permease [Acidobacteriota bacterium]
MKWPVRPPDTVLILANFVRKLVLQRNLVWNFVRRDLRARYVGSLMGFFWAVIHPLVLLASYSFVFSIVFQIRPYQSATENFALYLFCGILPWLYFQDTLARSCTSVTDHAHLIRKTVFPSEILPVSLLLSNLVYHLIGVGILCLVLGASGLLKWTVLFLPLYLGALMLLCLGLGWFTAAIQVFVRDAAQVLSVVLVFWFWLTPVFYSLDQVPDQYRPYLQANPLAMAVHGYRDCLLEGRLPAWQELAVLWLLAAVAFTAGGLVFRVTKREFADVL